MWIRRGCGSCCWARCTASIPAMGWLFAVALGLQERSARAVWRALLPLAIGHALAIGAAILLAALIGLVIPLGYLKWVVAAALLTFAVRHLSRHRHRRWSGMQVGMRDLAVWSLLMASAHGAGLMVLPILLSDRPAQTETVHAHHASPEPQLPGHAVPLTRLPDQAAPRTERAHRDADSHDRIPAGHRGDGCRGLLLGGPAAAPRGVDQSGSDLGIGARDHRGADAAALNACRLRSAACSVSRRLQKANRSSFSPRPGVM